MRLYKLVAVLAALVFAQVANANRAAEDIRVEGLQLTQTTRVDRTVFRYTYRVRLRNVGPGYTNINATVTSANAATVVVDGNVALPSIAERSSATTIETIVLQHDRTVTFNPADLRWQITANVVDAPPSSDPQESTSTGTLQIQGVQPGTFNPRSAAVSFQVTGTSLVMNPPERVHTMSGDNQEDRRTNPASSGVCFSKPQRVVDQCSKHHAFAPARIDIGEVQVKETFAQAVAWAGIKRLVATKIRS